MDNEDQPEPRRVEGSDSGHISETASASAAVTAEDQVHVSDEATVSVVIHRAAETAAQKRSKAARWAWLETATPVAAASVVTAVVVFSEGGGESAIIPILVIATLLVGVIFKVLVPQTQEAATTKLSTEASWGVGVRALGERLARQRVGLEDLAGGRGRRRAASGG